MRIMAMGDGIQDPQAWPACCPLKAGLETLSRVTEFSTHLNVQAINYVGVVNQTTDTIYPYTSGATGLSGTCNETLLASTLLGQAVRLLGNAQVVLPSGSENALMNVSQEGISRRPAVGSARKLAVLAIAAELWSYPD